MPTRMKMVLAALVALLFVPTSARSQGLSSPRAVLEANVEATGGSAWDAVKDMHTVMEMVMDMEMATMILTTESWIIKPDHMLTKIRMLEAPPGMPAGAGDNTVYITPEEGWIDTFQGKQDIESIPGAQRDQMKAGMFAKDELGLLQRPDSVFAMLDPREIDGSMAYVVEVKGAATTRRFYDQGSLLLVGVETPSPMGGMMMSRVSEYKEMQGVMIAHSIEVDLGGLGTQSITVKKVDINDGLTPEKLAEMVK